MQSGRVQQGAVLDSDGCHFGLWAPRADRVELVLVADDGALRFIELPPPTDAIWSVWVAGVEAGQQYAFRVHAPWAPQDGLRPQPEVLLLDPFARAFTPAPASMPSPPPLLSVVVAPVAPPRPVQPHPHHDPRVSHTGHDRVIIETHLAGLTRLHPQVPAEQRGSYRGMAHPAVIAHLLDLGVTTVQLLPVHQFVSEPFLAQRGLTNYWGYNSVGFFAPHGGYSSSGTRGEQVTEFRDLVDSLHAAGIEVFIDVVYNHTGEGDATGPTLCWRGIDEGGYYRRRPDGSLVDVTGCGNSVDTSQPQVQYLILESLRHWVREFGVDGFRFDLATTLIRDADLTVNPAHPLKVAIENDPVLADITLISEPWDIGPDGYQVGSWGPRFGEWNDTFRDDLRDFWRGSASGVATLATRLAGSSDLFDHHRPTSATINFVTAHDGFTARDLCSYEHKHNLANGEDNHDGNDSNRSSNYGVEGETDDEAINRLRRQQVKNLLCSQLLAVGVPMLTAGDELGRTQQGNNNAYCQDNPLSWHDWTLLDGPWREVRDFTADVVALRHRHRLLRRAEYHHGAEVLTSDGTPTGRIDLAWFSGHGEVMTASDWADPQRRLLGMFLADAEDALLLWFHAGPDPVEVVLPGHPWASDYRLLLSSADAAVLPPVAAAGEKLLIPARSVTVWAARGH